MTQCADCGLGDEVFPNQNFIPKLAQLFSNSHRQDSHMVSCFCGKDRSCLGLLKETKRLVAFCLKSFFSIVPSCVKHQCRRCFLQECATRCSRCSCRYYAKAVAAVGSKRSRGFEGDLTRCCALAEDHCDSAGRLDTALVMFFSENKLLGDQSFEELDRFFCGVLAPLSSANYFS